MNNMYKKLKGVKSQENCRIICVVMIIKSTYEKM